MTIGTFDGLASHKSYQWYIMTLPRDNRCFCCGEPLMGRFLLFIEGADDRQIWMHPDCGQALVEMVKGKGWPKNAADDSF